MTSRESCWSRVGVRWTNYLARVHVFFFPSGVLEASSRCWMGFVSIVGSRWNDSMAWLGIVPDSILARIMEYIMDQNPPCHFFFDVVVVSFRRKLWCVAVKMKIFCQVHHQVLVICSLSFLYIALGLRFSHDVESESSRWCYWFLRWYKSDFSRYFLYRWVKQCFCYFWSDHCRQRARRFCVCFQHDWFWHDKRDQ